LALIFQALCLFQSAFFYSLFQSNASCWPFGSRKLLTPRPSNRSGRETSFSLRGKPAALLEIAQKRSLKGEFMVMIAPSA
jgi:hypothetical protein